MIGKAAHQNLSDDAPGIKGRFYFVERTVRDFNQAGPFSKALLVCAVLVTGFIAADDIRLRNFISLRFDGIHSTQDAAQKLSVYEGLLGSDASQHLLLHHPGLTNEAAGQVRYLASAGKILLSISGLKATDPGQSYVAWYQQAGSHEYTSLGNLTLDSSGSGDILLPLASNIGLQNVLVTLEHSQNPQTPSSQQVVLSAQ